MIKQRLTRRQFFKVSAFGAASAAGMSAIGLAAVAHTPSQEAKAAMRAAAQQPQNPSLMQPTFNPIASTTAFGPITDISAGWDGTLWGINGQGEPHVFDSINNAWVPHGSGVDAAAFSFNSTAQSTYVAVFQGPNVMMLNAGDMSEVLEAMPIAAKWPNLPDSFKLGVSGAIANQTPGLNFQLVLINGGRYVSTDGTIPVGNLVDLKNWPDAAQWPAWKDGLIDAAFTLGTAKNRQYLMRAGAVVAVDFTTQEVTLGPISVNFLPSVGTLPAGWSIADVDAIAWSLASNKYLIFKDTAVVTNVPSVSSTTQYIGQAFENWPTSLNPVLGHAPNGRDGNLWSVLPQSRGGWTMQHNGETWTQLPNQADHVGVGQDDAVMLASAQRLWTVKPNSANPGYDVTPVSQASNLIQVSLGSTNAVFARDSSGNVYGWTPSTNPSDPSQGTLTQNAEIAANGGAAHIAVTNDGSLWHAKPGNNNQGDPNIYRSLTASELPPQAITVKQNSLVTAVTKVAATGYGASHCLALDNQNTPQVYSLASPFTFASTNNYDISGLGYTQMAQGLGQVYFVDQLSRSIIAVDIHTGAEVSRSAPTSPNAATNILYTNVVVDTTLELVYVATYNFNNWSDTTPGSVLALNAHDLSKVVWSYEPKTGVNLRPSLVGNKLVFGDRVGNIYAIDTTAAAALPAGTSPTAKVWALGTIILLNGAPYDGLPLGGATSYAPAVLANDQCFLSMCFSYNLLPGNPFFVDHFCAVWLDLETEPSVPYNTQEFHAVNIQYTDNIGAFPWLNQSVPPVVANIVPSLRDDTRHTYIFADCADAVVRIDPAGGTETFLMPTGSTVQTGLGWDADAATVWFGDNNGNLYGLDGNLQPAPHTPVNISPQASGGCTPLPYTDPSGNKTILAGVSGQTDFGYLYGFDPVSGNLASVQTGVTQILSMSAQISHGVVYVGGTIFSQTSQQPHPSIYGVRIDTITQGQRDFIIESQLMQDPDPSAGSTKVTAADGNVVPPSVARYQTHLTLVDDQKNPLPNETVKVWADADDGVTITVNSESYNIGPADAAYATIMTGVDGAVVITTTAKDVNASALRVWAPFMNPFERIVVYPDHEWHGRAAQCNADDTVKDPAKPNLNTVYSYKADATTPGSTAPKRLFPDDQKSQATNVASAVSQMNNGLKPGGNSAASLAGPLKTVHASNPAASYIAYTDLGGMHYGPTNARAKRTATIASGPFGFTLNFGPSGTTHTYTPMSHSEALTKIDQLQYPLWDPNNPDGNPTASTAHATSENKTPTFVVSRADNLFTDFWSWLVKTFDAAVDTIENVVVSVADDIVVGINFIVNKVKQAFKAIIKVIDDVINTIGSFFLQLAKLIEEAIEALSVLFHFGEIIKTHDWLQGQFEIQLDNLKQALTNEIQTNIDSALKQTETDIQNTFNSFEAQLGLTPNAQINNVKGRGATPHSVYTVQTQGGGSSSHAVQAGWGQDKAKVGLAKSTTPSQTSQASIAGNESKPATPATPTDNITDFFNMLVSKISGNGALAGTFSNLQQDFSNKFNPSSAAQFFSGLLKAFLDLIEDMVVASLQIAGAVVDSLIGIASDVITAIYAALNEPITFPPLDWLYNLLIGEQLTILNMVTLVAAIPVTVIVRAIKGAYPSQLLPINSNTGVQRSDTTALPAIAQAILTGANTGVVIIYGVSAAYCDAEGAGDAPPLPTKVAVGTGLLSLMLGFPLIYNDSSDVSGADWATYGLGAMITLMGVFGLPAIGLSSFEGKLLSGFSAVLGVFWLLLSILAFVNDGKRDPTTDEGFAATILSTIPVMLNPFKYVGELSAALVALIDIGANGAVALLSMIVSIESLGASAVREGGRYYMPWVANGSSQATSSP